MLKKITFLDIILKNKQILFALMAVGYLIAIFAFVISNPIDAGIFILGIVIGLLFSSTIVGVTTRW